MTDLTTVTLFLLWTGGENGRHQGDYTVGHIRTGRWREASAVL